MPQTVALSETAVANLRSRIRGFPLREQDLPSYRELVAAGIAEPVEAAGPGFRFTPWGQAHRDEILARESDRIERERFDPPDTSGLSDAAWALLRRVSSGERVPVDDITRPPYRELAEARIMFPVSGFATGPESAFRFTYWGWARREEWIARPAGSP